MLNRTFVTNTRGIELEITSDCNLFCINCDRSCRQARTKEYMTLDQVEKFVHQSLELDWEWEHIRLLGGEPTLHPQFFDIIKMKPGGWFIKYKKGGRVFFKRQKRGEFYPLAFTT